MSFDARPGQDEVLAAGDPVLVVLGGAGTGKTMTAAAVVRQMLDDARKVRSRRRALFLSFSRAADSQIIDRSADVLGKQAVYVDVTTFHAFAWRLVKRWGSAIGLPDPVLVSPSEDKLFGSPAGVTYDDLIPKALELVQVPAIKAHLQKRWAIIVSDEFQDTSRDQFDLINRVRGAARLLLLGDLNQCIYTNLPGSIGVGPERVQAGLELPGARKIELPDASHRDPTNILPAAAAAIRQRNFDHEAVRIAMRSGMLEVRHTAALTDEGPVVAALIAELRDGGHESVGIFSHHVDATAALSDHLTAEGITHEIVGLPDAVTSALQAHFEMLRYAADEGDAALIRRALGIFVTSVERGRSAPNLARQIVGQAPAPATLTSRLNDVDSALDAAESVADVLDLIEQAPNNIGLVRGGRSWTQGFRLLVSLLGPRLCRSASFPVGGFDALQAKLSDEQAAQLTYIGTTEPADVQLMGLYQSKGREADATIVVLREGDFYGREPEPMPTGSKLLYVVLTRARRKTIVLTLGSTLPPLIYPIALLSPTVTARAPTQ